MMLTQSIPSFQPTRPRFGNTPPSQDERLSQKNAVPLLGNSDFTTYVAMTENPSAAALYIRFHNPQRLTLDEKQQLLQQEETKMREAQARLEAATGQKTGVTQTFHLFDENA